jgi:hypothetical protein
MRYSGDESKSKGDPISIYKIFLDDANLTFNLVRYDPLSTNESIPSELVFDWMSCQRYNIISFKPNYEGAAIMTKVASGEDTRYRYSLDQNGKIIETPSSQPITTGGNAYSESDVVRNWWYKNSYLTYTATLTVRGLTGDYKINDLVKITVLFNGRPHSIASGIYSITGITDSIDSSGFTTTFQLIKKTTVKN